MSPPRNNGGAEAEPPDAFRIERATPFGRHPILTVFPGLDDLRPGRTIHRDAKVRRELFRSTSVEVVDADMWMYVAPWEMPEGARARWRPVVAPGADCIVVGGEHLRESPALTLYLDIYHELCHILQRHGGANLWEPGVRYVDRWTEVEAYRFVVDEARRLGVSHDFLRDYLKVEWISDGEHSELLGKLGIPTG